MYVDSQNDRVVTSPTDLSVWAACEWGFLRRLDAKLGRIDGALDEPDSMLERTAALGIAHEERYLEVLRSRFGADGVVEFADRPKPADYAAAAEQAREAMARRVPVLYQATFFDGWFLGFSDFLVLNKAGEYEVYDTKLARHAKISALLQLAGYAEQIEALGIPVGDRVHLVLGDGRVSSHDLIDILPVYRVQIERLRGVLTERVVATDPVEWGDPRFSACGRCVHCSVEVERHRDLVLVAGITVEQRRRLTEAGVDSIDELASIDELDSIDGVKAVGGSHRPIPGISPKVLDRLARQVRAQVASDEVPPTEGERPGERRPIVEVVSRKALDAVPASDDGDIFFDFEGDPLYTEDNRTWGLDYLFGLVDNDDAFVAFWAHDVAGERQALVDFLAFVRERRARHPGMHIYHYASYEKTHLLSLAARHGVGEDEVDELLRQNVLVDLYPIVRQALVVGSRSYSIKKLEPLYMPTTRTGYDVANAVDSIAAYANAIDVVRSGDVDEGQRLLDQVGDYNRYDCVSTRRLRDWLLTLRGDVHETVSTDGLSATDLTLVEAPLPPEPDPVFVALMALVEGVDPAQRTADQTAIALAASAIDYHRREAKKSWQEHFNRLEADIADFADDKDVFVVERASVEDEWAPPIKPARNWSRHLRLSLRPAPGSRLAVGAKPRALYDFPPPPGMKTSGPASRGFTGSIEISEIVGANDATVDTIVREVLPKGVDPYDALPVALTPGPPIATKVLSGAIAEWGESLLDHDASDLPADPVLDLLRRRPPRAVIAPIVGDDTVGAVVSTLLSAEQTYLAIQGPPGTGKTYVGSRVIARLVADHGWRVGIVAQSHAAVENVLDAVIEAGLDPDRVGKAPKDPERHASGWTPLTKKSGELDFLSLEGGLVFGGTAWTFAGSTVERRSLDLLVVEEAGQFSLAPTIAASVSAERLLLLGDPQQLPQVSQGTHPEPVDESALGWLADGRDVLPAEFGYFLAETRRMDAALCEPVSRLSYNGALRSRAPKRLLDGIEAGLHLEPVEHRGNTTASPEEAVRVVEVALDAVGRRWFDGPDDEVGRPLEPRDIIVVAPYNAQVHLLRDALDDAGLGDTQAGTVDMFQGREGVIAIVSLAASSGSESVRGLGFLVQPNRLNVALSRAQWAAYLVASPALQIGLPHSIAEMALLSSYVRLLDGAVASENRRLGEVKQGA
ncbi:MULTISPECIES: bifunctional RecB family nuclease/DEAD/DEAH box helicase [unclassified Frondihabitans]|uniref:TM0106 family RecB-like putative nuclease n=1 Tax=unclassified Frondihabitans TaxID=2626248 RepID=UPI000FBB204A|nr:MULTISPECIES: bifunctional RecB family nuclease/DEAD/DEAH box helicase [unclassified Frondihabitans]RPE73841.1 uncharacterized protein EDF37_3389 [Frondihabitans sp. PhB153]RPF04094.1 uncharacterized protein EDF39_2513 [Frondihabitans sp. PhB161]